MVIIKLWFTYFKYKVSQKFPRYFEIVLIYTQCFQITNIRLAIKIWPSLHIQIRAALVALGTLIPFIKVYSWVLNQIWNIITIFGIWIWYLVEGPYGTWHHITNPQYIHYILYLNIAYLTDSNWYLCNVYTYILI